MAASGVRTKDLCVQVGYQVGTQNCSRDLLTIPATPATKPVDPACTNHHPSSSSSPHPVPRKSPQKLQGVPSSGNASDHPHKSSGSRPARKKSNPASAVQSLDPSSSQSSKKLSQDSPSKTSKILLNGTENTSKAGSSISMKHTLGENSEEASPNSHGKSSSIEAGMRSRPKHTKVIENNTGEHQISNNVVSLKQKTGENGLITKAELLDKATQQQEIVVHPLAKSPDDASTKEEQAEIDAAECSSVAGSNYETACGSVCGCDQLTETISIKESGVAVKVSDGTIGVEKRSGSGKVSGGNPEFGESRKSSIYRGSNSSDVSDESSCSSLSSSVNKPHKANDSRWESIQVVRSREGALGLNHFRLLKRLGCGDIGSVYLAELVGTKSYFAMKVMDKGALASRKKLLRAQTEREILQCLDHPFLPTLYTHFETETFSCLVMEFCPGGDLHTLRQKQPGKYFPEHAARFYVAEVLLSLEYLHMLGIIYRDLKPENVLVREDGHIMLSDFDLSLRCAVSPTLVQSAHADADPSKRNSGYCVQPACIEPSCVIQPSCVQPSCFAPRFLRSKKDKEKKQIKPKHKSDVGNQVSPLPELIAEPTNARSMSFVGTHEYLAPEIIKGEGHGSAVDWWTFGIFLYELLFGKTPFKGSGNRATLFNVVGQPLRFPESPTVSFAARDLIRGLLVKEPQHRLAYRRGATEVKQHPFFQSVNWALIRCASPPDIPRSFDFDFPARPPAPPPAAPVPEVNNAGIDVKPSGNYLEIDFF